ncbi:2,3-bisphosphoglycerate-dependent phosphoglycerate mutase [Virgibacillus subterraneus]|uniref:2,3-bisphosphoglycerate-dependent phosphoglycerate mutase n=1 Tax=Virgibacillus subterraneus TaxID=621109 RepID=A0A1H9EQY1_9BACI|nr:histidine phosphatase family protein [Virgibacillus subterraneus]SEQ28166.1 2,3-bisphosphoglycerate-dependent phosphoglycerate mutase [Virgibacillus subterraneus]
MKNLYLIRHCTADGQHMDSPLTNEGIRQAQLLSDFFTEQNINIDKIISSPYLRAIESIKPYAEQNNIEVKIDDRLKERILSEHPIDDWMDVLEQSFTDLDFNLPGGESSNDTVNRAKLVIESVQSDKNATNVILVSHGNLMALLLKQYDPSFGFEGWKSLRNPDVYLINIEGNNHSIECLWGD